VYYIAERFGHQLKYYHAVSGNFIQDQDQATEFATEEAALSRVRKLGYGYVTFEEEYP
jgi:hypothetical protein